MARDIGEGLRPAAREAAESVRTTAQEGVESVKQEGQSAAADVKDKRKPQKRRSGSSSRAKLLATQWWIHFRTRR